MLRRYRPDVVHAQGIDLPGYLAVHGAVPSVVTVHGILGEENEVRCRLEDSRTSISTTATLLERPTIRRAKDVISISPYVAHHYGSQSAAAFTTSRMQLHQSISDAPTNAGERTPVICGTHHPAQGSCGSRACIWKNQ